MAVDKSSTALRAEIESPSKAPPEAFFRCARHMRQMVTRMSGQISDFQDLVIDVEEDERNPLIRGKLERVHSKLRAIDRATTEAERRYQVLNRAVRSLFRGGAPGLGGDDRRGGRRTRLRRRG